MIVCQSVQGVICLFTATLVQMVDLKDRINKPRSLRGTPSYAYINKSCLLGVIFTSLIGFSFGFVWWAKETRRGNFNHVSLEQLAQERQEYSTQAYVEVRKRIVESKRKEQEEEEMYRIGN